MAHLYTQCFVILYGLVQDILVYVFATNAPPPSSRNKRLRRPRIAIVGSGLTGVSAAAHCVGHGFDVKIFEARSKDKGLGGIWSRVNSTSSLQIHSIMFRFHPSIKWKDGYPKQQQIKDQIVNLWESYHLDDKTVFDSPVKSAQKNDQGKWVINGDEDSHGTFDGIVAAVGSCGDPKLPTLPHQESFNGQVFHSSELDGIDAKDKRVIVVGGGASAVEALEFAVKAGAANIDVLSRSDKWIIPRNAFVDILLACNILGQETILSFIPETLLRKFFYRDLEDIAPSDKGLFTDTPMVNSDLFDLIRAGKARWLRGDILSVAQEGINFNHRAKGVPKSGPGHEIFVKGDIIIMATGFVRPSLSFLPQEAFEPPYDPPNWYLQVFPPAYPSICTNNSTFVNAIATAGNYHIGIYTRLLLMFLIDPLSRPREYWMKRWIDMTRVMKRFAPTGAFDFFTYAELLYWFVFVVAFNPFRWKWAAFVFFGLGPEFPMAVVDKEDDARELLGVDSQPTDAH
ncbi:flavin-containing monooxygenase [Arthroderma uncinatum]|uniref:flavin-containing monooxygenase n=1 Tax=Arthroderma uncinatum TaxID=74035 RepID=UPI00144A627B|nr:flavin-containing monooxygenase [Arthroderma uncinatum]KAF3482604.1 flavin-containing monooxygenase [Arthroderma uncinatum]